jgi:hypothetical protein
MAFLNSDGFGGGSDSDGFGRIRADSEHPRREEFLRYSTVCMCILALQKRIPGSDGFGGRSDTDGFGRITGPQLWKSPTQQFSVVLRSENVKKVYTRVTRYYLVILSD